VEQAAADLVRGYAGIDAVIISERTAWLHQLRTGSVLSAARQVCAFLGRLRDTEYDLVLDFQGLFKSAVLAGLARGKRTIGFANARELATLFYTERAEAPAFDDHAIKRHMGLLRHLGIADTQTAFSTFWGAAEEASTAGFLSNSGTVSEGPLVCVHPSAAWPTKCWAGEKTAMLCDSLRRDFGVRIVFTGATAEQGYISGIQSHMHTPAVNLAGRTNLRELACLFAGAALVISMDSGPMHIACAVCTPVVALFGPTAPWRTGPFGAQASVVRKELACSPCYRKKICPQGHHRCMADITVQEVLQACSQHLLRQG
jgi:3-deoxy-D-manno-octulosonic-acid transferase/heptosyltransferase-1